MEETKTERKTYEEYLQAVNGLMEFFDGEECNQSGETYWDSKSGESLSLDCGYYWEGLESFKAYFEKKIAEANNGLKSETIQVVCAADTLKKWKRQDGTAVGKWERCGNTFEVRTDECETRIDNAEKGIWTYWARCPKCGRLARVTKFKPGIGIIQDEV